MAYDNNNSGMLSKNERKEKETHPDCQGSCEINGVQMWISGWTKTGKKGSKLAGKKFMSLSFKPKDQQAAKPATQAAPAINEPAFAKETTTPAGAALEDTPFWV